MAQGHIAKDNLEIKFFKPDSGFLSYWNHQLIKFEEEKRFAPQNQFCYYEKR